MKELYGNGYVPSIAQAIEEMKAEQGESFSPERINLAELERRTGISRGKLRRLKQNGFRGIPKGSDSGKHKFTKLTGYTGIIDTLLKQGVSNSTVILNRLLESGFEGRLTIVKDYIAAHKHLIPAKRQQIAPQGNRGRRYTTAPGEAYQICEYLEITPGEFFDTQTENPLKLSELNSAAKNLNEDQLSHLIAIAKGLH